MVGRSAAHIGGAAHRNANVAVRISGNLNVARDHPFRLDVAFEGRIKALSTDVYWNFWGLFIIDSLQYYERDRRN